MTTPITALHYSEMTDDIRDELNAGFARLKLEDEQYGIQLTSDNQINIAIDSVSSVNSFNSYITIQESDQHLVVDSGNDTLIIPDYNKVRGRSEYQVLQYGVKEPWGKNANIVKGPIHIRTGSPGIYYKIDDCVFFACTDSPPETNTANFGLACLSPWIEHFGHRMQAPLSYQPDYPFAEINFTTKERHPSVTAADNQRSSIVLYKREPSDYKILSISHDKPWMCLVPVSLAINGQNTGWPGAPLALDLIAMIDTGGTWPYLNDPNGILWTKPWSNQKVPPRWTQGVIRKSNNCYPYTTYCQAINADVTLTVRDDHGATYTFHIDPSKLPPSARELTDDYNAKIGPETLIITEKCWFLGFDSTPGYCGINIGGLTTLFHRILIDYASKRVGFKPKLPTEKLFEYIG